MYCILSKDGNFVLVYYVDEEKPTMFTRRRFIELFGEDALPCPESDVGGAINPVALPRVELLAQEARVDKYFESIRRLVDSWKGSIFSFSFCVSYTNHWAKRLGVEELENTEHHKLFDNLQAENYRRSFRNRVKKYSKNRAPISVKDIIDEIKVSYAKKGIHLD